MFSLSRVPAYEQAFCKALLRQEFPYREMAERCDHLPVTNPMQHFSSRFEESSSESTSSSVNMSQSALGTSSSNIRPAGPKSVRVATAVRSAAGRALDELDGDDENFRLPQLRATSSFFGRTSTSGSGARNRSADGEPVFRLEALEELTPSVSRDFLDLLLTEQRRLKIEQQRSTEAHFLGSTKVCSLAILLVLF